MYIRNNIFCVLRTDGDTPKIQNSIVTYLRYIDDNLLIWKETPSAKPTVFDNLKSDLNDQCNLNWETDNLHTEISFLDLTVKINYSEDICNTKTYQKPHNLFLYIPAQSSHPPGILKKAYIRPTKHLLETKLRY